MRELSKSKGFVVVPRETGGDTATEIMEESEKGSQKEAEEAENAESDDSEKAKDSGKVAALPHRNCTPWTSRRIVAAFLRHQRYYKYLQVFSRVCHRACLPRG